MKIFAPYTVLICTQTELHLLLPNGRSKFYFFLYRIFPFFLLALNINLVIQAMNDLPPFLLWPLVIGITAICILLWFKKFVTELSINKINVELKTQTIHGAENHSFLQNDIEKIIYKLKYGRGGGTFFYIQLYNKQKIEIITIPSTHMNEQCTIAIIQHLKTITNLPIEKYR